MNLGYEVEAEDMIAAMGSEIIRDFQGYCDRVYDGETIMVSRPKEHNIVMLSEAKYNELLRFSENAAYLEKIDRSFRQLETGEVVHKTMEELRAMER